MSGVLLGVLSTLGVVAALLLARRLVFWRMRHWRGHHGSRGGCRRAGWHGGGHGGWRGRGSRGFGFGAVLGNDGVGRAAGEVLKRKLDISEEQEPIVDHAWIDARTALREVSEELDATRATIAGALRGEAVDEAALAAAFARQDDAVARARRALVSAVKQVHAVLTPEQRERAASFVGRAEPGAAG